MLLVNKLTVLQSLKTCQAYHVLIHVQFFLQAEADLRLSQAEFDRQYEVTKLLLDGISTAHVGSVRRSSKTVHTFPHKAYWV